MTPTETLRDALGLVFEAWRADLREVARLAIRAGYRVGRWR